MTPLDELLSIADFEAAAREAMAPMTAAYYLGGAGDELTLGWNCTAYDRLRLRPRVLVDVSTIDPALELLGARLPNPVLIAPTAYHRLVDPDGEIATARAAGRVGAAMVVSTLATTRFDKVARAASSQLWFQLYVQSDRGFTRELVAGVEEAGYRALCLTVDTPVFGSRLRELKAKFTLPPGLERENLVALGEEAATTGHRKHAGQVYHSLLDPTLTWKDVEWLLSITRLPLLLKGVMCGDEAARAAEVGCAGVIVSNHGARNLDTVPATLDALPEVVDAVAGRVPVLVDGGIRRGTDVLKALALGAIAVLVGRPVLYGLAVGGEAGVVRVLEILDAELRMAMALTGRRKLGEIDATVLWP